MKPLLFCLLALIVLLAGPALADRRRRLWRQPARYGRAGGVGLVGRLDRVDRVLAAGHPHRRGPAARGGVVGLVMLTVAVTTASEAGWP